MKTYAKYLAAAVFGLAVCVGAVQAAGQSSELHIATDGKFSAKNIVVIQKTDAAIYGRVTWGNAFVRLTVLVQKQGSTTALVKNNGGAATYEEIQVGDVLEVAGTLSPGSDTLLIAASKIRDLSLNKETKTLSGIVKSVDYSGSFTLPDKKLGTVKVYVDGYTTITKGARTIALGEVVAGDKVSDIKGTYDYENKTLTATSFTVYQNPEVFKAKNFEGTLRSIAGTAMPTTMVITVGKTDYTVSFAANAAVNSKNKSPTELSRFTVGDKVRFYGAIRKTNLTEIDADSVRNLSF